MENPGKNAPLFGFTVCTCQSTKFHPYKLYISEISNHYSIYWAYIKSKFNFGPNAYKKLITALLDSFSDNWYQCWNWVGSYGSCFLWIIQVRHALKIIWVWPGLDHVRREIKKCTIWKCNHQFHCNVRISWSMPTFCINICCWL